MIMKPKDPAGAILRAYYDALNGNVIHDGEEVYCGTLIPRDTDKYVLIFIKDMEPQRTGEGIIYNVFVGLQVVSMQAVNEGDETVVNDIVEQVIEIVGEPETLHADGYKIETSTPSAFDLDKEMTETSYNLIRTITMNNWIEQK